jgi:hypothetical protein
MDNGEFSYQLQLSAIVNSEWIMVNSAISFQQSVISFQLSAIVNSEWIMVNWAIRYQLSAISFQKSEEK